MSRISFARRALKYVPSSLTLLLLAGTSVAGNTNLSSRVPPTNTALPAISGTPIVGETLLASTGGWTGSRIDYSVRWYRCNAGGADCLTLASATRKSYKLIGADAGFRLRVTVFASNSYGSAASTSVPTQAIAVASTPSLPPPPPPPSSPPPPTPLPPPVAPSNLTLPSLAGSSQQGATLTASTGSWSGESIHYAIAWKRCAATDGGCLTIPTSGGSSYQLGTADVGAAIRIHVLATNPGGSASATSPATSVVSPLPSKPANTQIPQVNGVASVGQTVTGSSGSWSGGPTSYAYQWKRCDVGGSACVDVPLGNTTTYVASNSDVGFTLRILVTAANATGATDSMSAPTAVVTPPAAPPAAPAVPAVAGPVAPASYVVPVGAVRVSSSEGLIAALQQSVARDIVLAAGVYDSAAPFQNGSGHRIYSETLGGAVLKAGLVIGGNFGGGNGLVRGVAFDVADPSKTFQSSMVNTWGSAGRGAKVLDATFDGHGVVSAGVLARQPDGLVVQRVIVERVTDYGVFFQVPYPGYYSFVAATPTLVEDAVITGVYRASRGSANGTAEAGIWAGNNSTVRRVQVRDTGWMGIWTGGDCNDALFEDLEIGNIHGNAPGYGPIGTGIYLEHYTRRTVFRRFRISGVYEAGIKTEWADPAYAGTNPIPGESLGASHANLFEDGEISSIVDGVSFSDSTRDTIRRVKFIGQTRAAIRDFRGTGNSYNSLGNDYSQIAAGARPIDTRHVNDS